MRDVPEKITGGQIPGGQVKTLGLYSVEIQCLGQRNDMILSML